MLFRSCMWLCPWRGVLGLVLVPLPPPGQGYSSLSFFPAGVALRGPTRSTRTSCSTTPVATVCIHQRGQHHGPSLSVPSNLSSLLSLPPPLLRSDRCPAVPRTCTCHSLCLKHSPLSLPGSLPLPQASSYTDPSEKPSLTPPWI